MTIRINQVSVEFTLEKERTFADLTASLRAWATVENLAVVGILADGRALGPDDQTPLAVIDGVEVETVPADGHDIARIDVIARFFSLLALGWQNRDQGLISELRKEFPSVKSALFPLLSPVAQRLEPWLGVLEAPWNDTEALERAARHVAQEAEALRREMQDPVAALAETLDTLEFSLVSLDAVSGLFQRGLDRDGLDLILRLFTVLEDLGRRAARARKGKAEGVTEWAQFNTELQPLLKDAAEALAADDYILLTDLLEYEISPRLQTVRALFPETANLDRVGELL